MLVKQFRFTSFCVLQVDAVFVASLFPNSLYESNPDIIPAPGLPDARCSDGLGLMVTKDNNGEEFLDWWNPAFKKLIEKGYYENRYCPLVANAWNKKGVDPELTPIDVCFSEKF